MAGCNRTNHTTPGLCTPDAGQMSSYEVGEQESLSRADIMDDISQRRDELRVVVSVAV